jgi:hypothetical protein
MLQMKTLKQEMKAKIVSYIDREYGCPPITYALLCLFQNNSLKQLGCWVYHTILQLKTFTWKKTSSVATSS